MLRLKVSGMTCGHCVATVTKAVEAVPAVDEVSVDLGRGEVRVKGAPDEAAVRRVIANAGYEVQSAA
ncbi:MAG: heavy metal transporter [Rhodospirillales bacterium 20-64-7]|nr:MAG: heavy metal transporter [Rhodospirillales bacterium 20-64-7]HQT76255.1 heavy-metal-associated domain-containing protein [Rhodopila sp.]